MHEIVTVMALTQRDAETMLNPYDENLSTDTNYDDCWCKISKGTANPDCPQCHGAGQVLLTSNEDGYWDYYSFMEDGTWCGDPIAKTREDDPETIPDNILTPKQKWIHIDTYTSDGVPNWTETYWNAYDEAIAQGMHPFFFDIHS